MISGKRYSVVELLTAQWTLRGVAALITLLISSTLKGLVM